MFSWFGIHASTNSLILETLYLIFKKEMCRRQVTNMDGRQTVKPVQNVRIVSYMSKGFDSFAETQHLEKKFLQVGNISVVTLRPNAWTSTGGIGKPFGSLKKRSWRNDTFESHINRLCSQSFATTNFRWKFEVTKPSHLSESYVQCRALWLQKGPSPIEVKDSEILKEACGCWLSAAELVEKCITESWSLISGFFSKNFYVPSRAVFSNLEHRSEKYLVKSWSRSERWEFKAIWCWCWWF